MLFLKLEPISLPPPVDKLPKWMKDGGVAILKQYFVLVQQRSRSLYVVHVYYFVILSVTVTVTVHTSVLIIKLHYTLTIDLADHFVNTRL